MDFGSISSSWNSQIPTAKEVSISIVISPYYSPRQIKSEAIKAYFRVPRFGFWWNYIIKNLDMNILSIIIFWYNFLQCWSGANPEDLKRIDGFAKNLLAVCTTYTCIIYVTCFWDIYIHLRCYMKEHISFYYRLLTKGDLLPVRSQGKYCFVVKFLYVPMKIKSNLNWSSHCMFNEMLMCKFWPFSL